MSYLPTRIQYSAAEVDSISPILENRVETGLTVDEICDAAVRFSDGTAGNILMRDAGGPAGLTEYMRGLGDPTGRMDQYEPELNSDLPGDPRDTTTPSAIAGVYRSLVLGDALAEEERAYLVDLLKRNTTGGGAHSSGVPAEWTVADKTGTGDYGRANDIAIAWRPGESPLFIALMSDRGWYDAEPSNALLADATREVVDALRD